LKRVFSSFLLIILLFPIVGIYISQHISLKQIKREVKANILHRWESQSIETITISTLDFKTKNIQFFPKDYEVEIDGKMYDIVEQIESGTTIILRCISDKKESEFKSMIKEQLIALFSSNSNQNKQTKSFIQFAQNLFFQENFSLNFLKSFGELEHNLFHYLSILSHVDIRLNSPPPEGF
jgi:hypothetical protein